MLARIWASGSSDAGPAWVSTRSCTSARTQASDSPACNTYCDPIRRTGGPPRPAVRMQSQAPGRRPVRSISSYSGSFPLLTPLCSPTAGRRRSEHQSADMTSLPHSGVFANHATKSIKLVKGGKFCRRAHYTHRSPRPGSSGREQVLRPEQSTCQNPIASVGPFRRRQKRRSTGPSPVGVKNLDGCGSALVLQTGFHAGKPRGDHHRSYVRTASSMFWDVQKSASDAAISDW